MEYTIKQVEKELDISIPNEIITAESRNDCVVKSGIIRTCTIPKVPVVKD